MNNATEVMEDSGLISGLRSALSSLNGRDVAIIAIKAKRDSGTIRRYMRGDIADKEFAERLLDMATAYLELSAKYESDIENLKF